MPSSIPLCWLTDEAVYTACSVTGNNGKGTANYHRHPYSVPPTLIGHEAFNELAQTLVQATRAVDLSVDRIRLIIPLYWCFTQVLEHSSRRLSEQTLLFDLEQYLPYPLEELSCAFHKLSSMRTLAVALPTAPMTKLIEALEACGLKIEQVGVDTLELALSAPDKSAVSDGVVIFDHCWTRIAVRSEEGILLRVRGASDRLDWKGEIGDLGDSLSEEITQSAVWQVCDLRTESAEDTPENARVHFETPRAVAERLACNPTVVDLRIGALATKGRSERVVQLATRSLYAAAVFALVATVGLHLHVRTIRTCVAAVDVERAKVYQDVFPGQPCPASATLRLASERIRLEALTRGQRGDSGPTIFSALDMLRNVVAALPDDVRVMLLEARLDELQVNLRGQTAEHRDAERMVEAIQRSAQLNVRPPRTTRLESGGVEFSILASSPGAKDRE